MYTVDIHWGPTGQWVVPHNEAKFWHKLGYYIERVK